MVQKTDNPFSAIGMNHAHEQLNAILKDDRGAIGITENATALHRYKAVESYEHNCLKESNIKPQKHHEQNLAKQTTFVNYSKETCQFFNGAWQSILGRHFTSLLT